MAAWHVWIILGIVLLIGEILTPGFVLACFGLGCFGSALVAYAGYSVQWQLFTFSAATLVLFFTMRPLVLTYLQPAQELPTNTDRLVGKIGRVTDRVDTHAHTGRVYVCGEDWKAVTLDGVVIEPEQKIRVVRVESATLVVRPLAAVEEETPCPPTTTQS